MASTKVDNPYNIDSIENDYISSSDIIEIVPGFIFNTYNPYGKWKDDLDIRQQTLVYSEPNGVNFDLNKANIDFYNTPGDHSFSIGLPPTDFTKLFYNPEKYTDLNNVKKSSFTLQFLPSFNINPPSELSISYPNIDDITINITEDTDLDLYPSSRKISSNTTNKMYIIDDKIYIPHIDSYFYNLDYTAEGQYLKFPNGSILTNEQINCFLKRTVVTDSKGRSWNNDVIYNIPLLDVSDFPGYEFYKNQLGIYLILHFPSSINQNETTYGLPLYLDNIDNIAIAPELNEEKYIDDHYGKLLDNNYGYFVKDLVIKIPTSATRFYIYSDLDQQCQTGIENLGDQKYLIIGTNYDSLITSTLAPDFSALTIKGMYEKISNTNISNIPLIHEGNSNTIRYYIKFE